MTPARLIGQTLAETENAMRIYNAWFGKSAFSRIAITQQPEFNFGQSWPTLVYLPLSAYLDSTQRWQLMGLQSRFTEFIDEVTPHEVSHQWWGHMVGWSTFHDQWLSEGFATFSAGLYLQLTEKSPDKCLKYWESARQRILEKNAFGRRANDAGPVWMGLRLASMKNANGYSHVVYRKGAYVLHMLRQLMYDSKLGDKPFIDMMHDFVAHHMNGNASTESFQRVVEQHMSPLMDVAGNHKMDWFFSEWVYGTAVPRYKFDYTVTPAEDGKWLLKGRLTQSDVPANFVMQVPIYLDFGGQVVQLGRVKMAGNTTVDSLNVTLPKQPKRVLINYWHDVLEQ
jgi:aminopeptidase N